MAIRGVKAVACDTVPATIHLIWVTRLQRPYCVHSMGGSPLVPGSHEVRGQLRCVLQAALAPRFIILLTTRSLGVQAGEQGLGNFVGGGGYEARGALRAWPHHL